ncbi:TIGR02444 family protein [Chromatiaceae bacterium AAb-1]|nr:TIGR02444 family protein [Chromatiaceae bacterium AAb-1]
MPAEFSEQAFWQFSLKVYADTKATCLQWQNHYDANVNLLLLLCYVEATGYTLAAHQISRLHAAITKFSNLYTKPLRAIRQQLPGSNLTSAQQQQLKQSLLSTELTAEKTEQQLLLQQLPALQIQKANCLPEQYLAVLNISLTEELSQQIIDLRQASQRYITSLP